MEKMKITNGKTINPAKHVRILHNYSLMEVQEKLGLFEHLQDEEDEKEQQILRIKPLGFI